MAVEDEASNFIVLVGNDYFVQKYFERKIGERKLRGDPFLAALGDQAGKRIAAARRRRLGEQGLEIGKGITARADGRSIHRGPRGIRTTTITECGGAASPAAMR